jgi:hypothetical protein
MKILKQLLFTFAAVFCFSVAASAQKPDKTPVPRPSPPVIIVKPKGDEKPKEDKPKNDDRKKPNTAILDFSRKFKIESV